MAGGDTQSGVPARVPWRILCLLWLPFLLSVWREESLRFLIEILNVSFTEAFHSKLLWHYFSLLNLVPNLFHTVWRLYWHQIEWQRHQRTDICRHHSFDYLHHGVALLLWLHKVDLHLSWILGIQYFLPAHWHHRHSVATESRSSHGLDFIHLHSI